jgi:hypothetical protein
MKTYSEAVQAVKTIKKTAAQCGAWDAKELLCAATSMNILLQEIYGVSVFEAENDIDAAE